MSRIEHVIIVITNRFKYIMLVVLDADVSASEPANIATVRSASPWACALP